VVQHSGITSVRPARHIDPQYADLLQQAVSNGVEVLAYKTQCSSQGSLITTPCKVMV
jgi:sugar fermentation stimulation protein A